MISVAGLYDDHLFSFVATTLIKKLKNIKLIAIIIVLATYILGMLITNDAVLLTLIPFTLVICASTNQNKSALNIIILQTIAANMGSALTPMGDPQNIFLYAEYGVSFMEFIKIMLPVTIIGLTLVVITTLVVIPNKVVDVEVDVPKLLVKPMIVHFAIFFLVLLVILKVIPDYYALIGTLIITAIFCRKLITRPDYNLLLTFVCFFIITGNVSRMTEVKNLVAHLLNSNTSVYFTALITSQFISNVPASVLLRTFTDAQFFKPLLQGVNVGAMGTIFASLASLITLKFVQKDFPTRKKEYFIKYTVLCVIYITIISTILLNL
jgi:Na+/H+ antiporter NhaD/arsenite permease-like protein